MRIFATTFTAAFMNHIQNEHTGYYLPAEWEKQGAVQLTWPHALTDWQPYLQDIIATEVELAKVIAKYEKVIIVTQDTDATKQHFTPDEQQQISFYKTPINDTWARDHAFISLLSKENNAPARLLDFRFNGWGNKFEAKKDNQINRRLIEQHAVEGQYIDHNDLVLEGGSIESDGKGTILTTSICLLAPHRNQPMTQTDIENELLNRLHAKRILWIDHGQLHGDDTDGHIDTTVRFAPNDTLLYMGCNDESDSQYEDFKAMEEQLHTLRTLEGKPYRLLRLPMPAAIIEDGERLPATYANFVIINGAVIVPTYGQPALDQEAMETIKATFPDRDIIPIDATTVIRQHGSLHCLTMQYPAEVIR